MNKQRFRTLLDKYFEGTLTDAETEFLHRFDSEMIQKKKVIFKSEKHRLETKTSLYSAIRKSQQNTRRTLWRVAAGFLILIGLGTTAFYFTPSQNQEASVLQITHTTAWGQQQNVVLPDGTKVTLNVGSTISYPEQFTASKRNVTLSGEAFFDVVRNTTAPFIIHTDEITTTVLGTSFNINTQDKEHISVTVATGKVRVASDRDNEVILAPKQQATYNLTTKAISTREVNLEKYLDWKDGILRFEDVTIAEASKKLEQWYNVSVNVLNDDIASCRFSGKFNNETLSTVLESLTNLKTNMKYRVLETGEIQIKGMCN